MLQPATDYYCTTYIDELEPVFWWLSETSELFQPNCKLGLDKIHYPKNKKKLPLAPLTNLWACKIHYPKNKKKLPLAPLTNLWAWNPSFQLIHDQNGPKISYDPDRSLATKQPRVYIASGSHDEKRRWSNESNFRFSSIVSDYGPMISVDQGHWLEDGVIA